MTRSRATVLGLAFCTAFAALATGCISNHYTIPGAELRRMAEAPDEERGERVRVLQRWTTSDDPDPYAPVAETHAPARQTAGGGPQTTAGSHDASVSLRFGAVRDACDRSARSGGYGARHWGGGVRSGVRTGGGTVHASAPSEGPVRAAAPGGSGTKGGPKPSGGTRPAPGGKSGGGGGGGDGIGDLGDARALIVAAVVGAAVLTTVLVVTEGLRFDGWADLEPTQPVYLVMRDGRQERVTLEDLDAVDLSAVREAMVTRDDGGVDELSRAPLNRAAGFVWRMEGGAIGVNVGEPDSVLVGAALMQFGYFPIQELGLLASVALGFGTEAEGDVIGSQYGLELDIIPLALGRFHFGAYGSAQMNWSAADGGSLVAGVWHEPALQAGGLVEIDLTTRLAISARAGAMWEQRNDAFMPPTIVTSAGLAVY